jgi:hypothetical protein
MKKSLKIIALLLTICNCKLEPLGFYPEFEIITHYPSKLYALSNNDWITLYNEFKSIRGKLIIADLDSFGLINTPTFFGCRESSLQDRNQAIALSKELLLKLSKFTNVYDTTLLELEWASKRNGGDIFNDWIVIFQNQIYKSLEVIDTKIMLSLCDDAQCIAGHHYNNIYIPDKDIVDIDSAINIINGYKIDYYCNGLKSIIITDSLIISNKVKKVIYPVNKSNYIEFRVAWKIPIGECEECDEWYIYVDVVYGDIIYIYQTFVC